MKYPKVTRRENNIYYRRRNRAIGSHSRWGVRNPDGLSSYLNGEKYMTAVERKNFRLPCGRTVAESWAALRKCWLGFYITKDQDDNDGKVEFAYRIRKIQAEMGIQPTNFDPEILDENTANRIDALYRKSPPALNEPVKNREESTIESNDFDYAQIMNGSDSSSQNMPAPRQEIFTRRDKSCPSPAYQPSVNVEVKVTNYENSCYNGPPKPPNKNQVHVIRHKTIYKKQCQVQPSDQDNFAVSGPESTLAGPDPTRLPIEPIFRREFCEYPPAEDPTRPPIEPIFRREFCEYPPAEDPPVGFIKQNLVSMTLHKTKWKGVEKEKDIKRKSKSCRYISKL